MQTLTECETCGDSFDAHRNSGFYQVKYCKPCGHAWIKKLYKYEESLKRAGSHKTRCKKYGGRFTVVNSLVVFERDKWLCGLCGTSVDQELLWPDPMSKSLDHIRPLSLRGDHSYENVQLAHLRCNISKGNRV